LFDVFDVDFEVGFRRFAGARLFGAFGGFHKYLGSIKDGVGHLLGDP
jgi:hypothetical protein